MYNCRLDIINKNRKERIMKLIKIFLKKRKTSSTNNAHEQCINLSEEEKN